VIKFTPITTFSIIIKKISILNDLSNEMKKRKNKRIEAKPLPTRKLLNNTTTTIMPIPPSRSTYFSIHDASMNEYEKFGKGLKWID
jgi:hypothetical protein